MKGRRRRREDEGRSIEKWRKRRRDARGEGRKINGKEVGDNQGREGEGKNRRR